MSFILEMLEKSIRKITPDKFTKCSKAKLATTYGQIKGSEQAGNCVLQSSLAIAQEIGLIRLCEEEIETFDHFFNECPCLLQARR